MSSMGRSRARQASWVAAAAALVLAAAPAGALGGAAADVAAEHAAWSSAPALLAASPAHAAQRARLAEAALAFAVLEVPGPAPGSGRDLGSALADLAASQGLEGGDPRVAVFAAGPTASAPRLAAALAEVVESFLALNEAARGAFGQAPDPTLLAEGERLLAEPASLLADLPRALPVEPDARVAAARVALLAAAARFAAAWGSTPAPQRAGLVLDASPAVGLDLEGVDSHWAQDAALIVDAGGDDLYTNNAGGAGWLPGLGIACPPELSSSMGAGGAAAVLDFAGNDRYVGGRSCGVNGGGFGGAGLLLDLGGDDEYRAGAIGTNGGGAYGSGMLLDLGDGRDTYRAGATVLGEELGLAVNGGAVLGDGLLLDGGGDDAYRAGALAATGGAILGAGAVVDLGGDDLYEAAALASLEGVEPLSIAVHGGGLAGAGLLLDAAGHDAYRAGGGAANGGSAAGAGALLDLAGDDRYEAGGLGANGGAYGGAALLVDLAGDDLYRAAAVAVNGEAVVPEACLAGPCLTTHPVPAAALLLDGGGLDRYEDAHGSAEDRSVVPNGVGGARLDLPVQGPVGMHAAPVSAGAGLPLRTLAVVECADLLPGRCVWVYAGPAEEHQIGPPLVCALNRCEWPLGYEPLPGPGPLRADAGLGGLEGSLDPGAGRAEVRTSVRASLAAGPVAHAVEVPVAV